MIEFVLRKINHDETEDTMPFTAEAKNGSGTWERVDITEHEAPKNDFLDYEIRCIDPDCHASMTIKHGSFKAAHFAHAVGSNTEKCVFASEPESEEHLRAKKTLAEQLLLRPECKNCKIEFERIVVGGNKKRIVDVFVQFPNGSSEAHEIQLSRTSIEECRERTTDYHNAGIDDVVWWFGGKNGEDVELATWAKRENGAYGRIRITDRIHRF